MRHRFAYSRAVLLGLSLLASSISLSAQAQDRVKHKERPLTITRHASPGPRGTGIETRDNGNEIVAWGGFSANGYGYGRRGGESARRAVRNEAVRERTAGVYGYGLDGLGGSFGNDDLRSGGGFNNPFYGNSYNGYTGYGGVPTAFAFGPAFANRHITDSEDDDTVDIPGPTPGELGYSASTTALGLSGQDDD